MSAHPHRWWALTAVALGIFCIQLDSFALNLALPAIGRGLGTSSDDVQWVVSVYLLTVGALMLGAGGLADRVGRRLVLGVGLGLFGVASLVCAVAPALPVLVAGRALQGAGGALIMPAGLALLSTVFAPGRRERAIGAAIGLGGVATAIGPFVGGALTEALGWRAVFWLNVPVAAVAVLAALRAPESRAPRAGGDFDLPGLALGTAALAGLALFVDRGPVSATGVMAAASAVLLGVGFVRRERRAPAPLVELSLLRNGPFVALTGAGMVANAATVVFLFVVPWSLQRVWSLDVAAAGLAFLVPAGLMAVAGPVAGAVRAPRAVVTMAVCLVAAAIAVAALPLAGSLPLYLALSAAAGAALGVANALTLVATQALVRPERAGEGSGVTKTAITVAAGIGVVLSGPVADSTPAAPTADVAAVVLITTGAGCLVAAAVLVLWLRSGTRGAPAPV